MKASSHTKRFNLLPLFLALAFIASPSFAAEDTDSSWQVSADIYFWAPKIIASTPGGADSTLPFYKILDTLEMTFMGGVKAQKDRWSIATDAVYMDLSEKVNRDSNYDPAVVDITGNVGLKSWIVTPTVGYAVHDTDEARVEVIAGARYLWLESSAKVDFDDVTRFDKSASGNYWDVVFGARADLKLSDKWFVPLYFDIGTGDTDLTWQTYAGIGYNFGKVSTIVGYRYLDFQFDDNNKVLAGMTVKGPVAALTFKF